MKYITVRDENGNILRQLSYKTYDENHMKRFNLLKPHCKEINPQHYIVDIGSIGSKFLKAI